MGNLLVSSLCPLQCQHSAMAQLSHSSGVNNAINEWQHSVIASLHCSPFLGLRFFNEKQQKW